MFNLKKGGGAGGPFGQERPMSSCGQDKLMMQGCDEGAPQSGRRSQLAQGPYHNIQNYKLTK